MGTIVRDFTGNLNMDSHPTRMPKGDFIDSLNITRDSRDSNSDQVITGIAGNRLVAYTFQPDTTNTCIGAYNDDIKNRVIYFVWNSGGYHSVLLYDNATRTITKILESITDTTNVDILNLQLLYKVNNINVIHREEDGDLLLWNDAYNRPGQINIDNFINGVYGNLITDDMIRLAKMPPLDECSVAYVDDPTSPVNNLKKKLFQFCFAWGYSTGEVSTISPASKVALPIGAGEVSTESDPGVDNVIEVQLTAGGLDYKFIRLFGRESIGAGWGNWYIIDTIDRDDYLIPPGATYTYRFLNDGQYSDADPLYMELLFDYCADKCNAQTLINGNVIVQGAITEGYDQIKRQDINVQITASSIPAPNEGVTPANPTITVHSYNVVVPPFVSKRTDFTIGSSISVGCEYNIKFNVPVYGGDDYLGITATAISTGNDAAAISLVAQTLATSLNSQVNPTAFRNVSYVAPNIVRVNNTAYFIDAIITSATSPVFFTGGNATWKWAAKYRLGLVYVDKYGKTNGVISFVTTDIDPTDFSLTTPDFNIDGTGQPLIPVINASINHIPPDWAVAYYWVRTVNQNTDNFLQYITIDVQQDANYYYFGIQNLYVFKEDNTGFVPSYTFKSGDRIRLFASMNATAPYYNLLAQPYDYEILGTVERNMTGGSNKGLYIKTKKPSGSSPISTAYYYFVELYTPFVRTGEETMVFYGFGESYPIYTDTITGIHYHVGQIQNQTVSQAATFEFRDGDVYYKYRPMYKLNGSGVVDPTTVYNAGCMDANFSDFWASSVNSNGTAFVIDPNAKRIFKPTLIRFGQAYQPGTDINGLNRFYPNNFDEYFRDYGAIMNFSIRDKMLHVYQKIKVGRVPIYGQIVKDTGSNEQLIVSDKLLNTIQYYIGNYGIGDHPESLASNNYADYFLSNIRGVYCRLSQNGLEPISISHNINNFAVTQLGGRDFNYKCYGVFDAYNNLYITALEETPSLPSKTLMWNEQRNGFESFLSYKPEMMVCLNQMLITFKNGQLYTHDDDANYNTFYGTQYESSITPVFNDNILEKKNWMNVTQQASEAWGMPVITTSNKTFGTNTLQNSNLLASEFEDLDGLYNSALLQDAGSVGGIGNGSGMTGVYMIAKFQLNQPTRDSYLNIVAIGYQSSVKNITK